MHGPRTVDEARQRIQEAQQLLARGDAARAAGSMQAVLRIEPDNAEAHYTLAVAMRHQRLFPAALSTLETLLAAKPEFGRAHQEVGYNYIALQDYLRAGAAFERAVNADPSLVNSWKCLAKLYAEGGNKAKRQAAEEQIAFLTSLPPELIAVTGYMAEDRLDDAERLCKHFLRENQTHVEGMRLLAEVLTRNKVYYEAEFLLESCVEFAPDHVQARIQYANILLRVQKFARACEQTQTLLEKLDEGAANGADTTLDLVRSLHGAACSGVGRNQEAIGSFEALAQAHPDNHIFPVSAAHVYKADGDLDRAVALYRESYRLKPDHGDAYWSLANTKSYAFTDAEIEQMAALADASDTADADRIQLCFALGSAFENRGDFEGAFGYYAKGNARKQAGTYHSPAHLQVRIDSQIAACTPALFASRPDVGCPAPDPIFIVGLPRAGSTLIEQILASHSRVDGTMELHNILNLAKRLRGRDEVDAESPRYPRILGELEPDYFRRFGEQFINDTRAYRGDAPFFIDKMPNNFFHIGLIRLILPNAKVIDARRHPMACCFSGFKQLFGEGQEFSYGLKEIGNYYRQYVKLMDHWDAVLSGFVLRVQHEDVVEDLEGQVRRLLDFCGLEFEPACLEYHRTERSIRTPSSEQVRQPIYRSGLDQWRNFEPWLGPLKDALGPAFVP